MVEATLWGGRSERLSFYSLQCLLMCVWFFCYKSTNQSRIILRRHHQYSHRLLGSRERALRVIRVIPRLIGAKIVHTLAVYREYCWKHLFARESGVRHDAVDVRAKFREETLARDGVALARRW